MIWGSAAVLVMDGEGRYVDADQAALDLLGVASLEALRALPRGAFEPLPPDPEHDAAFRETFLDALFQGLLGEGAIKRTDGELVRVRTAIIREADGGYRALLYPVERPTTNLVPRIFRIADVLTEWRSAERDLIHVGPDTDAGRELAAEVALLRDQYRQLFNRSIGAKA